MASARDPFSRRSRLYLDRVERDLEHRTPLQIVERVEKLVDEHDSSRRRTLRMNPAESGMSPRALELLSSDMATRLTEGHPGDKIYPHGAQNAIIDEIEAIVISIARRQFRAEFVEWRPVSTSMANAAIFFSLLGRGDRILVQSYEGGGNYSYHRQGSAGLAGAKVDDIPWRGEAFEVDVDRLERLADEVRPKMLVVGGSNVLFPYPLREIRRIADRHGALVVYDGAHLGLLISKGEFQSPLEEGAHLVTVSTHKIMGGPVGGLVLTNDPDLAAAILRLTFPGLLQTRDQNKYAALAVALAETEANGAALARRMVANARALAAALEQWGFTVVASERGYTATHQIFLDLGAEAQIFEERCLAANLILSDCALAGEKYSGRRSGARLATHELTRLGMDPSDMNLVAKLITRAARGESSRSVARDVETLAGRFDGSRFRLDRQASIEPR